MHKARAFFFVCAGLLCLLPLAASAQPPPYVAQWGAHGTGEANSTSPFGVDVDASSNVYVANHNNCPIPPRKNVLEVAVRAGEMEAHFH